MHRAWGGSELRISHVECAHHYDHGGGVLGQAKTEHDSLVAWKEFGDAVHRPWIDGEERSANVGGTQEFTGER